MKTRSAAYYRKNPLSTPEMVVGGLVAAAVLGIGGYFVWSHYQAAAAAPPALPAGGVSAPTVSATSGTVPYDPSTYGPAPAGTVQASG